MEVSVAFEQHRRHLMDIAYRLVGSVSEAEDMVQEAFSRLMRADLDQIDDLGGWLVVVVSRICLDHLKSARSRREVTVGQWMPEPLVDAGGVVDPAEIVTLDESVRMALLMVLERLTPAERVVFVLHEVFEYSFEEIAPMVDRSAAACRQLASRARRHVRAESGPPRAVDPGEMRRVAERFVEACAGGELEPLLEVLDPAVVGWADIGDRAPGLIQPNVGRDSVAARTMDFFGVRSGTRLHGEAGVLAVRGGRAFAVMVFTIAGGRVTAIYAIADPQKLSRIRV